MGKIPNADFGIYSGEGLELFIMKATRQVAVELQVLLRQVVLCAEKAQQAREGSNQGSSGVAAAGPGGGRGSSTSAGNETHGKPPHGYDLTCRFALANQDIMSYIAEFVQDQYLFIAPVSKDFRRAWG
ncbi:unnamed protein product, partial [Ectocarpus sp. 13 AM-2016]